MQPLRPGSLFAKRFEVVRYAGSGGMGTVYQACDRQSGATVALKILRDPVSASDPEREQAGRFAREAQLLSELRHPGIVSYAAHGQAESGERFLAMEWLDGEDLTCRLARGPLPARDCITLLRQIAAALSVAHERGIIHRDLKPSNLFLVGGELSRVKLLDFGIARRTISHTAMTQTGMVIGTPEYMAPEQARGAQGITAAADIFALGCVLYECLTGQPPFTADHLAAVLVRVLLEEPTPLEQRRPGLPGTLSQLLARMLVKAPERRLADASALRAALAELGELTGQWDSPAALITTMAEPTFAIHERGLFSVVLAAPAQDSLAAETVEEEAPLLRLSQRQALLGALAALGSTADFLAGGALVVTISQMSSATDQAVSAARAALVIKEHWPAAVVSLATGRGAIEGRVPVGEVVDHAARFLKRGATLPSKSATTEGFFVDDLSSRLLAGRFAQTPVPGGAVVKGKELEVDASRPLLGKPTPCVGREGELGILEAQLAGCIADSEAHAVLITAPPGTGKSRLRHEFLRRVAHREEAVTLLLGRGDMMMAGVPYGILSQALKRLCGLGGAEPIAEQRARLAERIGLHLAAPERGQLTELIGELCGIPLLTSASEHLTALRSDVQRMHSELRDALITWLRAECEAAPVLVVLDDLQWGDTLSVSLIDTALRELRGAPLCLLALARPEIDDLFPKLWRGRWLHSFSLKPLGRKACERLAQQVLGKQVPADAVARIVEQSAGNALFLEELIRAAGEGEAAQRLETVVAMLQARIGRLALGPRRAVRAASVFGRTFWRSGVAELLAIPGETAQVDEWLGVLVEAELIEAHADSRLAGEKQYSFRHALAREAAYSLLTESDLRTGHRLAARYLERMGESEPLLLAEHYSRAGEPERTLPLYVRAVEEASRALALPEARQHCLHALAALELLPESPAHRRQRVELLLHQVRLSMVSESSEQNLARLTEARRLLSALGEEGLREPADERRGAWIDLLFGRSHHYKNQQNEAIGYYQRVLPIAEALGDAQLLAVPSQFIGMALMTQGNVTRARPLLSRALALQERLDNDYDRLRTLSLYAASLVASGSYREGMALHEEALARATQSKQATAQGLALVVRGGSLLFSGDFPAALELGQRTLALSRQSSDHVYVYAALGYIGWAQSFLGNHAAARGARREAEELARQLGGRMMLADWFQAADAEIALRAGDFSEAISIAERLVPGYRTQAQLLGLALAEQTWGLALAGLGAARMQESESHLEAARELMERSEQVLVAARLRLEWSQVCRGRGELERAESLRAQAVAQFAASHCAHVIPGLIDAPCLKLG